MTQRTPLNLKILRGNPSGKPIRLEPTPEPIPCDTEPPDYLQLDGKASAVWRQLAPGLIRCGILTSADTALFGRYCDLLIRWQDAKAALDCIGAVVNGKQRGESILYRQLAELLLALRKSAWLNSLREIES